MNAQRGLHDTPATPLPAGLVLDFFLRAFTTRRVSALSLLARSIARDLRLRSRPIPAAPKMFAARLGFACAVAISILGFAQLTTSATILTGALAACAALEACFAVCVGCHIHRGVVRSCRPGPG